VQNTLPKQIIQPPVYLLIFLNLSIEMRYTFALSAALGAVTAIAAPQFIDLDMAIAAPDPTYTIASDATAQVVTINTDSLLASASAAATVTSIAITDVLSASASGVQKRAASSCTALPTGIAKYALPSGTASDNAAVFRANATYSSVAVNAPTPTNYNNTMTNQGASNNAYGYLGFHNLQDYDTNACAAKCNAVSFGSCPLPIYKLTSQGYWLSVFQHLL
jgi:hypothetical protein